MSYLFILSHKRIEGITHTLEICLLIISQYKIKTEIKMNLTGLDKDSLLFKLHL